MTTSTSEASSRPPDSRTGAVDDDQIGPPTEAGLARLGQPEVDVERQQHLELAWHVGVLRNGQQPRRISRLGQGPGHGGHAPFGC
jgi:hypothetical protein